ncbi:MAG: ComEC/Rec2 family competence protein [Bdellovibrionales bacterium]|nr:ComEC/Rec2 family competence protein [Bdellovibrionales bacterium]
MIRLAIALSILTLVLHSSLPSWRAKFTRPIHQQCLKYTPLSNSGDVRKEARNEIREVHQALVCGRNLKPSESLKNWKDLGLIHILVVSGGHLTILAKSLLAFLLLLPSLLKLSVTRLTTTVRVAKVLVFIAITLLALANQFEPPVLRAWLDHILRPALKKYGWQTTEGSFVTTWLALPAVSDESDMISLGLSFFASVVVESASERHYEHPLLLAVTLQTYLWWALLPFLLPFGLPHPIATLTNVILAPLLGAVLIPAALFTYLLGLNEVFPWIWHATEWIIHSFAGWLPPAAPALPGSTRWTALTYCALITMALALISRDQRLSRWERKNQTTWPIWTAAAVSLAIATAAHQVLNVKKRPLSPAAVLSQSDVKKIKRGKVCIPYQAIERRAHNKHCRRRRSDL